MEPSAFRYRRPATVEEALAVLAELGRVGCSSVKRRIARAVYQHLKQAQELSTTTATAAA